MVKAVKKQRKALPIFKFKQRILDSLKKSQVLTLIGETGSGKTTQVAQYLLESGNYSSIAVTQPRRVAAISVAKRVSQEKNSELGGTVGYSVRFENKTSSKTKIKYLTDGMLIRESMLDKDLTQYSVIIVDEAHERSINTDMILGLLKHILPLRPDLKVIVMSATIEAKRFAEFFNSKEILQVQGRTHPVEILHTQEEETDHMDASVIAVVQLHLELPPGDILVFLTGQEDIEDLQTILNRKKELLPKNSKGLWVVPMFSALPSHLQMKGFEEAPPDCRKVILATNIAETSLTIPGIKYVIDCGLVKERHYDPKTGMESLRVVKISKAAASQRAGRAGRTSAGRCFRLYTQTQTNSLSNYSQPEITRSNLQNLILQLKIIGHDPRCFYLMDKPADILIEKALKELQGLKALDFQENITNLGRKIAELPLPPVLARILLASLEPSHQCTKDILTIVALLCVENLCYYKKNEPNAKAIFKRPEGDHLTLLAVYNEWKQNKNKVWAKSHGVNILSIKRASMIRKQLKQYLQKYNPNWEPSQPEHVLHVLAQGYYTNSAFLSPDKKHYLTFKNREIVHIHPTSVLFASRNKPECIMFSEVVVTTKKYVREVSQVDPLLIQDLLSKVSK